MSAVSMILTTRGVVAALLTVVLGLAMVPVAPLSAVAIDDYSIPGVPMTPHFSDSLDQVTDRSDTFRIYLLAGQHVAVTMGSLSGTNDFDLYLFPPAATDFSTAAVANSSGVGSFESIAYTAPVAGWYYVRAYAFSGSGSYDMDYSRNWPVPQPYDTPERIWSSDRYTTAVELASANFPGWVNLDHVIIASGEDRAAADPLAASGLTWTYGAPILLVRTDVVPSSVITALQGVSNANGGVTVHVVGGDTTIPQARLTEIANQVPGVTFDRIMPAANRYELAGSIARRMQAERPGGYLTFLPGWHTVCVANGADPDKFFDALALSPLAANCGMPILLVEKDRIPPETTQARIDIGADTYIVGGGPETVSQAVAENIGPAPNDNDRWWGKDRYETARVIANEAKTPIFGSTKYLDEHNVGVAAKLPDALAGGAFTGLRGGPILLTNGQQLVWPTYSFLRNNTTQIGECYTLGGPNSISDHTHLEIAAALGP